jgi:predicted dehydrogenase
MSLIRMLAFPLHHLVNQMKKITLSTIITFITLTTIAKSVTDTSKPWTFITLDPGHFHAALVQKIMYPDLNSNVYVYAPSGNDLKLHLNRINSYNTRTSSPTKWNEIVYEGSDFFDKMLTEKNGNVVMLSGNNQKKTEYILNSIRSGFHVYADKPMVIQPTSFSQLEKAFQEAKKNNVLLYDIMTERYEITTMIQKELSHTPAIFGSLLKGSPEDPSITKESVHHYYKEVSGSPLQRPAWFYDTDQQGEGIVDVTTHLVDLVQWAAFPEQVIDYKKDIKVNSARSWSTAVTLSEFTASTREKTFPDYLKKYIDINGVLQVNCNGEINYTLKGVHAKVSVIWNYKAAPGGGDTHYSIMKGTLADLIIRQGLEQKFKPTLYIEKKNGLTESIVFNAFSAVEKKFPGISLQGNEKGWEIVIPEKYHEGHEAHFGRVTEKYLGFLKSGKLPDWEVPNMLAKYYTTITALKMSKKK